MIPIVEYKFDLVYIALSRLQKSLQSLIRSINEIPDNPKKDMDSVQLDNLYQSFNNIEAYLKDVQKRLEGVKK